MAWPLDLFNATPTPEQVRAQLERLLNSVEFARAARMRELLQFIVTQRLEGREERLTEYVIARDVFRRGGDFNPESDSIVRTEAARLRTRLEEYYQQSGRRDRVRVRIRRGDYLPVFLIQDRPGIVNYLLELYWDSPRWFIGLSLLLLVILFLLVIWEMR